MSQCSPPEPEKKISCTNKDVPKRSWIHIRIEGMGPITQRVDLETFLPDHRLPEALKDLEFKYLMKHENCFTEVPSADEAETSLREIVKEEHDQKAGKILMNLYLRQVNPPQHTDQSSNTKPGSELTQPHPKTATLESSAQQKLPGILRQEIAMVAEANQLGVNQHGLRIFKYPHILPFPDPYRPYVRTLRSQELEFRPKYVLLIGETGVGKSTLINLLANHLRGVRLIDDYRYEMIQEPYFKDQSSSVTSEIEMYTIIVPGRPQEPIVLIDTPGYGDTQGTIKDAEIDKKLEQLLAQKLTHIHLVCFVAKSSTVRLTDAQIYVYNKIVTLLGNQFQDNLMFLFTFSDNEVPQVSKAMVDPSSIVKPLIDKKIANKEDWFIKFNSSSLYTKEPMNLDQNSIHKLFWEFAQKGTEDLAKKIFEITPKSTELIALRSCLKKERANEMKLQKTEIATKMEQIVSLKESMHLDKSVKTHLEAAIKRVDSKLKQLKLQNPANTVKKPLDSNPFLTEDSSENNPLKKEQHKNAVESKSSKPRATPTAATAVGEEVLASEYELHLLNQRLVVLHTRMQATATSLELCYKDLLLSHWKIDCLRDQVRQDSMELDFDPLSKPNIDYLIQQDRLQNDNHRVSRRETIEMLCSHSTIFLQFMKRGGTMKNFEAIWEDLKKEQLSNTITGPSKTAEWWKFC
jgi:predicted GTPase